MSKVIVFFRDGSHIVETTDANQGWNFDLEPNKAIRRIFIARTDKDVEIAVAKWGRAEPDAK